MQKENEFVCRNCGSDDIRAWYPVPQQQGLIGLRRDFGNELIFDYDGVSYGDADAGENDEYHCADCDHNDPDLEKVVVHREVFDQTQRDLDVVRAMLVRNPAERVAIERLIELAERGLLVPVRRS